ncbi:MAG: YlmH/Sll1252 family protein [Blautia sp.]|nr:YlmH/Sll1252 family protein [Blautia sp.]MDY4516477.1 YlmH/Sll1252 family protein [Lachnospiraceae bacterium]
MDKSEEIFQKHLLDLAVASERRGIVTFSDFMNLNELNIFHNTFQKYSGVRCETFGGYETAERQIAAFIPDALYYDWDFPVSCLEIRPLNHKFSDSLSHRDYLGAILNLGTSRPKLGDILPENTCAHVFCIKSMAGFICSELTRIRHTTVICREISLSDFSFTPKTEILRGTIASVRLDSILALAFCSSRSSLTGLITGGKVFVNGKMIVSNGYSLKEGDVISARGLGKFRYLGITAYTKKGRCSVSIEKYI